jgi:hypothetical protein
MAVLQSTFRVCGFQGNKERRVKYRHIFHSALEILVRLRKALSIRDFLFLFCSFQLPSTSFRGVKKNNVTATGRLRGPKQLKQWIRPSELPSFPKVLHKASVDSPQRRVKTLRYYCARMISCGVPEINDVIVGKDIAGSRPACH